MTEPTAKETLELRLREAEERAALLDAQAKNAWKTVANLREDLRLLAGPTAAPKKRARKLKSYQVMRDILRENGGRMERSKLLTEMVARGLWKNRPDPERPFGTSITIGKTKKWIREDGAEIILSKELLRRPAGT